MMRHQPSLALAVTDLLAPVRLDRRAVVVPDERRGRESDLPASRLQPPADVDIVVGAQVDRIEATDGQERLAAKRHVAARHVLGDAIVQQDVRRPPRGTRDALRHRRIVGRHDVRPPGADHIGDEKWLHEICEPVGVDASIRVRIRDDFAAGLGQTDVARRAQAAVRDVDDARAWMHSGDRRRLVARPVVHDDDFVVGIREPVEG